MSQVAAMLGWTRRRTVRHLQTLNVQTGGMLLETRHEGNGRRYMVTLAALRGCMPDWFESVENLTSRVEEIEDAMKEHAWKLKTVASHVGTLHGDVGRLKKK